MCPGTPSVLFCDPLPHTLPVEVGRSCGSSNAPAHSTLDTNDFAMCALHRPAISSPCLPILHCKCRAVSFLVRCCVHPAGTLAGTMVASETLVASRALGNRFGGGVPTAAPATTCSCFFLDPPTGRPPPHETPFRNGFNTTFFSAFHCFTPHLFCLALALTSAFFALSACPSHTATL